MNEQTCTKPALLILGVDPDLAEGIRIYLEDSYQVYLISDSADLDGCLASFHAYLLLTDIDTADINTMHQLQNIKSAHPEMKIIMMYMFPDEEESREKSVLSAADDSISKPFSASVLKYKLDQLLSLSTKKSMVS